MAKKSPQQKFHAALFMYFQISMSDEEELLCRSDDLAGVLAHWGCMIPGIMKFAILMHRLCEVADQNNPHDFEPNLPINNQEMQKLLEEAFPPKAIDQLNRLLLTANQNIDGVQGDT